MWLTNHTAIKTKAYDYCAARMHLDVGLSNIETYLTKDKCSIQVIVTKVHSGQKSYSRCIPRVNSNSSDLVMRTTFSNELQCTLKNNFTTWLHAKQHCEQLGQTLLTIHSQTEMHDIVDILLHQYAPILGIYLGLQFKVSLCPVYHHMFNQDQIKLIFDNFKENDCTCSPIFTT